MKRLILMGGRPWVTGDKGKSFTEVLFRYFPSEVKLGFCIFAQPEEQWQETETWNTSMFDSFKGGRKIEFKTMTHANFQDVSKWADVIYIPGGDPFKLLEELKAYDLASLWDDKVAAGSSAGADLFAEGFSYLQDRSVGKGLGWINTTVIPHWRDNFNDYTSDDWSWAEKTLIKEFPDLPLLCIPEGHFVEFTVA